MNISNNKICLKPYWGDPNIALYFCENKYVNTNYIAEYYNTISALSYIFVGLYFVNINKKKELGWMSVLLGIGTMIMHATLKKYGQWMDEVSMLIITLLVIHKLSGFYLINLLFIFYAYLMVYFHYHENALVFASMFMINLLYIGYLIRKKVVKNIKLILYVVLMGGAMFCWFIDQIFCNYIVCEYMHALWHIGTALSMFFGFLTLD